MAVLSVIDMFCGVGGLSHGFTLEGFNVLAGIDSDDSCRYSFEYNNKSQFIHKKIEDISAIELAHLYPPQDTKILVGCAPCQPFSNYTKKKPKGDKWQLVKLFADLILEVKPDIISMENVPELESFDEGSVLNYFFESLKSEYELTKHIVYCPDYGIPQKRKRLVVFGSKYGQINLIEKTHAPEKYVTVEDAIKKLPPIDAGQIFEADPLHRSRKLSETNLLRIRQSKPGGTWRDWDEELVTSCHKRSTGKSYASVYGRMTWHEPSPTITTQAFNYGSGRFGHPEQDRALSLREIALLQTFPQDYQFADPEIGEYVFEKIGRHIGNAVPVLLGQIIAKSIKEHLSHE